MEDLSLHILDVVENATAAGATRIAIEIRENRGEDRLVIRIADNGRGMDAALLARVRDPFGTTRTTRRVGMGLALLDQAARETGGHLEIRSAPGAGTQVEATFHPSHIDCKPLGDVAATLVALVLGSPEVDFRFELERDGESTVIDTAEMRAELDGVPVIHPAVLKLIADTVRAAAANGGSADGQAED
jgi:hypothetical protein